MAINVSQAFHRTSANPVDESMALTKAEMLAVNDNLMPSKYLTVCQDDGCLYLYDKSATPSPETGKFTKFEGGGGEGSVTEDVTANTAVGAINSGDKVKSGTTLTNFVKQLLIKELAPTISFSASGSGVKEVGTSVTPTLTVNISSNGTGTPVSISFYNGSTLLETKDYVAGTTSYSHTMASAVTANTTVKGVLNYKKSDGTSATVEKSASYTFVMASYYGAVSSAPTSEAEIVALTKNVKNSKALTTTYSLSNQRSCYCYPASFGNLSSIKDGNNFEYISSYTKTSVTVDGTAYNVYTLTDPVTAASFKQIFA